MPSRSRTCPHCQKNIGLDQGFYFEADCMMCSECKKPIYGTTYSAKQTIDDSTRLRRIKYTTPIQSYTGNTTTGTTTTQQASYPYQQYAPHPSKEVKTFPGTHQNSVLPAGRQPYYPQHGPQQAGWSADHPL